MSKNFKDICDTVKEYIIPQRDKSTIWNSWFKSLLKSPGLNMKSI